MNSFKIPVHFQKKRPLNFEHLPKISGLIIYNPNKNLIKNPTTIDTPIAKNPGIIKLVARVRPVSSRLTANNNVGRGRNDEIDIKRLDHCNEIHWWNTHTHDNQHHNGGCCSLRDNDHCHYGN